jgi:probable rRNA maturation factor
VKSPVTIVNRHRCLRPAHGPQERLAARVFAAERKRGSADIILTGAALVRSLNRRYRKKNKTTDVLSFSYGDKGKPDETGSWGEIYINLDAVRSEARCERIALRESLARRVVHGLLHLLGYDHQDDHTAEAMAAREQRYLAAAGFAAPSLGAESAHRPRRQRKR